MVQMYEGYMAWLSLFCLESERRIRTTGQGLGSGDSGQLA